MSAVRRPQLFVSYKKAQIYEQEDHVLHFSLHFLLSRYSQLFPLLRWFWRWEKQTLCCMKIMLNSSDTLAVLCVNSNLTPQLADKRRADESCGEIHRLLLCCIVWIQLCKIYSFITLKPHQHLWCGLSHQVICQRVI